MVTSRVPSRRLILQLVRIKSKVSPTISTRRKTLLKISWEMTEGFIIPARPRTPSKLNRSLPIKLPTAIQCRPFIAAETEVANSGADVPAATMVTAMTQSEMPIYRATLDACLTMRCPPRTINTNPTRNKP